MSRVNADWILPNGIIVPIEHYHIGTVIDHPEKFGMTTKQIEDIYKKHNEKMSPFLEGKAREEIMTLLFKKKFIRTRQRINGSYIIQLNRLTPKINDYIWQWANKETQSAMDKYDDVFIHLLKGNKMIKTSLDELASGKTIKESKRRLLTENECKKITIINESNIDLVPDYFTYAEDYIDTETDQWIIDEILDNNHELMMKHLK